MDVEKMANYGNGIVESLSSPEYKKVEKQMMMPTIGVIIKEVGLFGLLKLFCRWRSEEQKMKRHNWLKIEEKGIPREVFELTFQFIALMKVLDHMVGIEKARAIITAIYEKTEKKLAANKSALNLFLIPVKDLNACEFYVLHISQETPCWLFGPTDRPTMHSLPLKLCYLKSYCA